MNLLPTLLCALGLQTVVTVGGILLAELVFEEERARALEWLSSQRAVMDEAHAGFFLNFQGENASAKCKAAGPCTYSSNGGPSGRPAHVSGDFCCPFANVYCENQVPWQGEKQFFW